MQLFSITALRHAYPASTIKTSTYIVAIETRWDEWGLGAGGAGRGLESVPIFAAIIAHAGGLACWLGRADAARRANTVLKGRSASVLFLARRPRWVPLYRFSRPLRLMRAVWHDGGVERTRRVGRTRRSRADRHRCYF